MEQLLSILFYFPVCCFNLIVHLWPLKAISGIAEQLKGSLMGSKNQFTGLSLIHCVTFAAL